MQVPYQERLLTSISLETNFTVDSYPPAVYYSEDTFNFYDFANQLLFILGIILLVLCLMIIPRKMHLHSVTLIQYPAIIFISAGLLLENESDFVKSTLASLKPLAFIGGISIG